MIVVVVVVDNHWYVVALFIVPFKLLFGLDTVKFAVLWRTRSNFRLPAEAFVTALATYYISESSSGTLVLES